MGPSITHALDESLSKLEVSIQKQFASLEKQWAHLQQVEDKNQSIPSKDVTQEKKAIQPQNESAILFDSLCSCTTNRPQMHERTCFRSFQHKRVHAIAGRLKILSYLLRFRLEVQRAPFAFARDLKVYANFSMRSTVEWDSEAFALVYETFQVMAKLTECTAKELQKKFRYCLMTLRKLFEDGKAWPTDMTTDGQNLLHVGTFSSRTDGSECRC